jgi:hypothetical protein
MPIINVRNEDTVGFAAEGAILYITKGNYLAEAGHCLAFFLIVYTPSTNVREVIIKRFLSILSEKSYKICRNEE